MKYWDNPQDIPISKSEMLAHHNGDGNCQAWSALLRDCFRVQGINSDRIWVRPIYPLVDRAVLVKDWEFDNNPSAGGNHPYYVYAEARPIPGIPAQGNDDPPYAFNAHWITRYNNTYYDPSYGTPKVTGQDRDILYENASFDGYGNLGVTRARKNDPVLNEVTYVVDN